jgi:(p)ppGpp synthase/HD superfamily hydrolase
VKRGSIEYFICLAAELHQGQVDKAGEPYVLHPIRVAFKYDLKTLEERVLGLLHDALEDTILAEKKMVAVNKIRKLGFSSEFASAWDLLTKKKSKSYKQYIRAIGKSDLATKVKLADLFDNSDEERLSRLDKKTAKRLRKKYDWALKELGWIW